MTPRRVALVVHPRKDEAESLLDDVRGLLTSRGIEIHDSAPDLVVSLGGDGTMLRAAQLAHRADSPLFGVNLGTLGYLTEVDAEHAATALERVLDGDYHVEERMMLSCSASTPEGDIERVGLNEVLVERSSRYRLVSLHVEVSGEKLATFSADGIIVATPTGSTAYAMSAGGPIVSPRAHVLVLVPVSPHMIFSRPFVLAPDDVVTIEIQDGQDASLALDGSSGSGLPPGARVRVAKHPDPLRLVRISGPGFIDRMRAKLGLPD